MTEPREALAALLHDPEGICDDDQVGDPRTCERLADRLIAAGVHLGDEALRAALREIADAEDKPGWSDTDTMEWMQRTAYAALAAQENPT